MFPWQPDPLPSDELFQGDSLLNRPKRRMLPKTPVPDILLKICFKDQGAVSLTYLSILKEGFTPMFSLL